MLVENVQRARPVLLPSGRKYAIVQDDQGSWTSEVSSSRRFSVLECDSTVRDMCTPVKDRPPVTAGTADAELMSALRASSIVPIF